MAHECNGSLKDRSVDKVALWSSLRKLVFENCATVRYLESMTKEDVLALRKALGLSQRQFAKILKTSDMSIARAEKNGPSRQLVLLIERALANGELKLSDRKIDPE
jgi:DNA-binding transcriptional regulator YiaG